jgi:hypothetical protein
MNASAIEVTENQPTPQPSPRPQLVPSPAVDHDAEQRAEGAVFRDAVIGAVIGALVLAPIYAVLVGLALRNSGTTLLPAMLMAAGVGVLAGVFIGGWSGTLVGSHTLETFEREHRPKIPAGGSEEQQGA